MNWLRNWWRRLWCSHCCATKTLVTAVCEHGRELPYLTRLWKCPHCGLDKMPRSGWYAGGGYD